MNGEKIAPLCQRGDLQPGGPTSTSATTVTTTSATSTTTNHDVAECPEGWARNQTSCYWVVLDPSDWIEAKNGCPQIHLSAHLASSGSKMENDFIGRLHSGSGHNFWLGGTDSDDEGNWRWIDGTPFNFTSWESSEGSGGVQDSCLAISNRYNDYYETFWWFDYECYTSYSYICEINLDK